MITLVNRQILHWSKLKAFAFELTLTQIFEKLFYLFPKQALVFTYLQYKLFKNTVGKGEIAHNEQFLLFPQSFLSFRRTFCYFHQIQNCRVQTLSVWNCLKSVVWERVKMGRKHIWKRRKHKLPAFSSFPTIFQKPL